MNGSTISILAVSDEGILISHTSLTQLFIYSRKGFLFSIIPFAESLGDAIWTPRGNILCTILQMDSYTSNGVMLLSKESGKVIDKTEMLYPMAFSIFNNDTIYLTEGLTEKVFQSTDDGLTWHPLITSQNGWMCVRAIRVGNKFDFIFWMKEVSNDSKSRRLRMYKKKSDGTIKYKTINVFLGDGRKILTNNYSYIAYDGNMTIFLAEYGINAIHVFSVTGQYRCQLLSSNDLIEQPKILDVDRKNQLLFIGQTKAVVSVFKLTQPDGNGCWI